MGEDVISRVLGLLKVCVFAFLRFYVSLSLFESVLMLLCLFFIRHLVD